MNPDSRHSPLVHQNLVTQQASTLAGLAEEHRQPRWALRHRPRPPTPSTPVLKNEILQLGGRLARRCSSRRWGWGSPKDKFARSRSCISRLWFLFLAIPASPTRRADLRHRTPQGGAPLGKLQLSTSRTHTNSVIEPTNRIHTNSVIEPTNRIHKNRREGSQNAPAGPRVDRTTQAP